MKSIAAIFVLSDLTLLALGGILAAMTQTQVVHALDLEVTRVGTGAAVVQHEKCKILSITKEQLVFDGNPITEQQLENIKTDQRVIIRVSSELPTSRTVMVLSKLAQAGVQVSIEVKEQTDK